MDNLGTFRVRLLLLRLVLLVVVLVILYGFTTERPFQRKSGGLLNHVHARTDTNQRANSRRKEP